MHLMIDGHCLGEAFLAVTCLVGVTILAGIAFARSFDRRLAGRDRPVTSRGLPPAAVGEVRKV